MSERACLKRLAGLTHWVGIASLRTRRRPLQLTVGITVGLARTIGRAIVASLSVIDMAVSASWRLGVAPRTIGCTVTSRLPILPTIVAVFSPILCQIWINKQRQSLKQSIIEYTHHCTTPSPHRGGVGFPHWSIHVQLLLQWLFRFSVSIISSENNSKNTGGDAGLWCVSQQPDN